MNTIALTVLVCLAHACHKMRRFRNLPRFFPERSPGRTASIMVSVYYSQLKGRNRRAIAIVCGRLKTSIHFLYSEFESTNAAFGCSTRVSVRNTRSASDSIKFTRHHSTRRNEERKRTRIGVKESALVSLSHSLSSRAVANSSLARFMPPPIGRRAGRSAAVVGKSPLPSGVGGRADLLCRPRASPKGIRVDGMDVKYH